MLQGGEVCVCEIVDALEIPQSSLSTHLQCLRNAGIVKVSKRGTWAYYAIEDWAKTLIEALNVHFGAFHHPDLKQDEERLQARLAMRQQGCCVLGQGQLIQIGERPRK